MRERDLAVIVLQQIAAGALQNSGSSPGETGRMLAQLRAMPAGFDADEANIRIGNESVEDADRVAAAADAGDDRIRRAAFLLHDLCTGFKTDHTMEIAHHRGIGMSAESGAE